ncbi:MAG: YdcF family protein [Pseudomonadota bacterium]|nr:YdcF family protein [Pseudomonadota bacterium]
MILWVTGFLFFVRDVPREVQSPALVTDAVVVLTGGSMRLESGFELLKDGRASAMFISGVNKGVTVRDLFETETPWEDKLLDAVEVGYGARNTLENALETASWMGRRGFRSFYLVTASYHMPRSLEEFDRQMTDIQIIPYPVFPENVHLEGWWRWPGTTTLLMREYVKFLWSALRHFSTM